MNYFPVFIQPPQIFLQSVTSPELIQGKGGLLGGLHHGCLVEGPLKIPRGGIYSTGGV